jgi:hypothetical protein
VEAAFLIIALVLVLMAFAPVTPSKVARSTPARTALRTRIARQLHLWDRYLDGLHGGGLWRE